MVFQTMAVQLKFGTTAACFGLVHVLLSYVVKLSFFPPQTHNNPYDTYRCMQSESDEDSDDAPSPMYT